MPSLSFMPGEAYSLGEKSDEAEVPTLEGTSRRCFLITKKAAGYISESLTTG